MKFSESWLREWVNPNINTQDMVEQFTMAGLEVDAVEPVAGDFTGVVVGEILEAEQHPDADKLRVCKVAGSPAGTVQVVCGAPNARPGIKIPFALVGASLPPDENGKAFKIKKAKLRGVESFGMLCAQTELQAGDDDDGLWELPLDAPVGTDLREYLSLNDAIIEVDLTPNRSDCLGIKGLARELGVLTQTDVTSITIGSAPIDSSLSRNVSLHAPKGCPRYVGRVIEGVDVSKPTPLWMQEKLRRSGVRSLDIVVDVTNYVLLELGHPMHAFDLDKLSGDISVRMASAGEQLALLNDQEVKLKENTLLVADDSGAIAMAGIMGGKSTAVTESTNNVFLECAFFDPIHIAGRARNYGLHTDSSHRFERGVDYGSLEQALERATELLLTLAGGRAGPITKAESKADLPADKVVSLSKKRIEVGLGLAIADKQVEDILSRLGLEQTNKTDSGWSYSVPPYRFDIAIEADLLEELARVYGYNNLPTTTVRVSAALPEKPESVLSVDSLKDHMASRGYREAITYSFIDPANHRILFGEKPAVSVLNPISSDMSLMRTSLLPGMLATCSSNVKRQASRVRIFETGLRFQPLEGFDPGTLENLEQTQGIAGLIYGTRAALGWHGNKSDADFYDIKGDVESLLAVTGKPVAFEAGTVDGLHPGQTAIVSLAGESIGYVGALHPEIVKAFDLPKTAYVFELDLAPVLDIVPPSFKPLSRFPEVARDIAVIVDQEITSAKLENAIRAVAGDSLKNLKVFDVYSGKGIDSERKSVAFNLIFQHPSRTLTEEEINVPMASVVEHLKETFDAQLR